LTILFLDVSNRITYKLFFHANVLISFVCDYYFESPQVMVKVFKAFYRTCLNTQDHFWAWEWIMHKKGDD